MTAKNKPQSDLKVLLVCLGNICRSPAAQGILASCAKARGMALTLDSAGTAAYHVGNHADPRSISELASRGIDIQSQHARQVNESDFEHFDWLIAMDRSNLNNLLAQCPLSLSHKVRLFSSFVNDGGEDVADPYYGADDGFAAMADHLTLLSNQFLDFIDSSSD